MLLQNAVYSVGVVDADIRIFHGYEVPIGTTYNSFLLVDDEVTLIDCVKAPFSEEFLGNIREVIGDRPVSRIVCNHVEPDHSGSFPSVIAAYPEVRVYGTANCERELRAYYPDVEFQFEIVRAGDSLASSAHTLDFIPMPMVHWPDSMSTYLREHKILFSNDALGQHIGTGEMFDSELSEELLLALAGNYYANIVLPFGLQVKKLLESISTLDIETVCPSHGVILREGIGSMIAKYAAWADNETDESRALIVYDTMWGTTAKLATIIAEEYRAKGLDVTMLSLSDVHYSYASAEMLEARYIAVGSPTLNNGMLPSVAAFLTYIKGLKPKNRVGKAFGSYGWSGESVKDVHSVLEAMGFEMEEPLSTKWNV